MNEEPQEAFLQEEQVTLVLKAGTTVRVKGISVSLVADTEVRVSRDSALAVEHAEPLYDHETVP